MTKFLQMTQVPWIDKLWYKIAVMARLRHQSGNSIVKIAADSIAERKQQIKEKGGDAKSNQKDFLSRFLEIESSNSAVPHW